MAERKKPPSRPPEVERRRRRPRSFEEAGAPEEPAEAAPRRPLPPREEEVKVYGRNACLALFVRRRDDIVRAYVDADLVGSFAPLLRFCAETRRAYRLVQPGELDAITGSRHHEGICVVARRRPPARLEEVLADRGAAVLLGLENVRNPHNLGAILRIAAHFGVRAVIAEGAEIPSHGAGARVAEGGAEWVDGVPVADLGAALSDVRRAGFRIVALSSRARASIYEADLPARLCLLLGSEAEGLSPRLREAADLRVRIPGTGRVDSLNVATAAAIALSEVSRPHPPRR